MDFDLELPLPRLSARLLGARCFSALSDDALFRTCGVRIAFSGRAGGYSKAPYEHLNLGDHVGDDPAMVAANRRLLLDALDAGQARLLTLNQVHGIKGVVASSLDDAEWASVQEQARAGADFAVVEQKNLAALLCFADCVPLIVVSPTGRFAVVHAGWRGALAGIARRAVHTLICCDVKDVYGSSLQNESRDFHAALSTNKVQADEELAAKYRSLASSYNVYIGPHIHQECFECSEEVAAQFLAAFGEAVLSSLRHISLLKALCADLQQAGVDPRRICDAQICTKCHSDEYYSYRASSGRCGRHGALAFRPSS